MSCGGCKYNAIRVQQKNRLIFEKMCTAARCPLYELSDLKRLKFWLFLEELVAYQGAGLGSDVQQVVSRFKPSAKRAFVVFRRVLLGGE